MSTTSATTTRVAAAAIAVLALTACTPDQADEPIGQFSAPQAATTDPSRAATTATSPTGTPDPVRPSQEPQDVVTDAPATPGPDDATEPSQEPTEAPQPSDAPTGVPTEDSTADGEQVAHDLGSEAPANEDDHAHDDADNTFDFSDVDRTDPEQVVAHLACYFYASDGSDEQPAKIARRVSSFATPELATQMADMRISGDPGQVRLVQPVETVDAGDGWYEQRCKVETRDAETYEPTAEVAAVNLRVHVTAQPDGRVLADEFVVTY